MLNALMEDFKILEGEMVAVSLPPRSIIDNKGNRIEKASGRALSIRKRPKAPIQILLGGHYDTVYPPKDLPEHSLLLGEKIIGPGVADMKGGLVILLKSLEAFEKSPYAAQIGWEILINPDEEIGSPSSTPLFVQAAKRNQIGLIFEPSFSDGCFVSQRKGSANYSLIVRGRAAHSGRDFSFGRSAIYAMSAFIHQVERTQVKENAWINVGTVEGGVATNIVPDLSICRINVRASKVSDLLNMKKTLNSLVKECEKRDGIKMELIEDSFRAPKILDSKTQTLFDDFKQCAEELQIPFELSESGGVTDGNILANEGLPTIDSLGVVGGKLHTPEEYLDVSSLIQRTQLASLFFYHLAIGEITIP